MQLYESVVSIKPSLTCCGMAEATIGGGHIDADDVPNFTKWVKEKREKLTGATLMTYVMAPQVPQDRTKATYEALLKEGWKPLHHWQGKQGYPIQMFGLELKDLDPKTEEQFWGFLSKKRND